MNIAIVGLGHAFNKQYNALKAIDEINKIVLCDKDKEKQENYKCIGDYKVLEEDLVIVATGPRTHYKIVEDLIKCGKKVILEKPIVVSNTELSCLKRLVNRNNFYNALHFAYGLEVEYFIREIKEKPSYIKCFISDNYVNNGHIKEEARELAGSYLDEVINPLSACLRMFGGDVLFVSVNKKKYINDIDDYYSLANFKINNIDIEIETLWNEEESKKYIDLYYEDRVIRLDSMKQRVSDLTNNRILFQGNGDRMTNHYLGVYRDYLEKKSNLEISFKLHEELLKGVKE